MSKGTVISGSGGGEYSVSVDLDNAAIAARISYLQIHRVNVSVELSSANQEMNKLENEYNALLAAQGLLIDSYSADPLKETFLALIEKSKECAAQAAKVGIQRSTVAALVAEIASIDKELARLSASPSAVTLNAWCADYSESLSGEVGMIEVPGGERDEHIQIRPGYDDDAEYTPSRDGMLRQPYADVPAATTYNLAMLPGWQKWLPRYRLAEIDSIDTQTNTCSLTIEAASSSQGGINVNHETSFSDVPIEYMTCDAAAFAVGDRVVVEFVAQTETGIEGNWGSDKVKVIGFAESPKPCSADTWLCWPSADNAVFGWGDPYENPPGTPVNPPLGTVQTSYSDTARIARKISGTNVEHGVNLIAGLRDWRHDSSALVLSWDGNTIYSGGVAVKTVSYGMRAACVRWFSGTPMLLWMLDSPDRIYSQECIITDDVVTSLVGVETWCDVSGGWIRSTSWCEFSADGNSAVINYSADVTSNWAVSVAVPAVLTGQTIAPVVEAQSTAYSITWGYAPVSGILAYAGTRRFIAKSQYQGNSLVHVWLDVEIKADVYEEWDNKIYVDEGDEYTNWTVGCGDPEQVVQTNPNWADPGWVGSLGWKRRFTIDCDLKIGNQSAMPSLRVSQEEQRYVAHMNAATAGYYDPDNPPPNYGGQLPNPPGPLPPIWTDWCGARVQIVIPEDERRNFYTGSPAIDARFSRVSVVDLGYSDDVGATYTTRMQSNIYRNGSLASSKEVSGDYGGVLWPSFDDIDDETDLRNAISQSARLSVRSTINLAALDIGQSKTVQCAWGREASESSDDYIDHLEGEDIDSLLSIDGETKPRIVIRGAGRALGLLKKG